MARGSLLLVIHNTLGSPAGRVALATRDIGAVFRLLTEQGVSQRTVAQLTGMAQSEVSEVLHGRRVQAYDVLVRIAEGLGVPRGWMGLADSSGYAGNPEHPAMDDDMRRRRFLGAASLALLGQTVIGEAGGLPLLTGQRTGALAATDVPWITDLAARLRALDHAQGGGSVHAAARGAAENVIGALRATATPSRDLLLAVTRLCRIAGWSAFDAGDRPAFWQAHATALDLARQARHLPTVTTIVDDAGRAEILSGNHQQAAKLFELASARRAPDAVGWGLLGSAYAPHAPDAARDALARLRDADGSDTIDATSMVGHVSLDVGDHDAAVAAYTQVLPNRSGRVAVQEMAPLAITHLRAGEVKVGVQHAEKAFELGSKIRSEQAADALSRMGAALAQQPDSTAQDLARRVRQPQPA